MQNLRQRTGLHLVILGVYQYLPIFFNTIDTIFLIQLKNKKSFNAQPFTEKIFFKNSL